MSEMGAWGEQASQLQIKWGGGEDLGVVGTPTSDRGDDTTMARVKWC